MKKKNILFFIILAVSLIIIGGCIGKVDRTFGPFELNITSDSDTIVQGNSVTLTAISGFEDYSWEIISADDHGCNIDKLGSDKAQLNTTYDISNDTYIITIKITDSKGNSGTKKFLITRPYVQYSTSELYYLSSNSSQLEVYDMPNFDHWVVDTGAGYFIDSDVNPGYFRPSNSVPALANIYAVDDEGHKSLTVSIKIYNWSYIYSNPLQDGFVSHQGLNNTVYSSGTSANVGSDTNNLAVERAFFSFTIPTGITHIYYAQQRFSKLSSTPSGIFYNNSIYYKYIGINAIPLAGLSGSVFATLNADIDNVGNHYVSYYQSDTVVSRYLYFYEGSYILDRINYCIGNNFDVGLRFYDENFSERTYSLYFTGEYGNPSYKPRLYIKYY
ncbi:hypothetical protein J7L48_07375 [bacterium]|nr:hypothetical protein [bacterium]